MQGSPGPVGDVTVFQAGEKFRESGVLYARSVQLDDGSILATAENYSPEPPIVHFPIYKSTDYGRTWSKLSELRDTHRNIGARYQPNLFRLPETVGAYPAGTILAAANFIPSDLSSTYIDVYASRDNGVTWEFVSEVASGGEARPNNGLTPVWEPFLLFFEGTLTIYYADQRDPAHGQKTVHQVTTDLVNWGPIVNDAAFEPYALRPGMPTVARLGTGKWILLYELAGAPEGNVPAYYKIADDPWSFDAAQPIALIANNGARPQSSPYVVVTRSGRVIVSGGQSSVLFINDNGGDANSWRAFTPSQPSGYSRCLELITEGADANAQEWLLIVGGGWFGNSASNRVSAGVVDPNAI